MKIFKKKKRVVRILSVDGGGIRGLVPALILEEFENLMRKNNRPRPLHEIFDLMAGTSTGGLIVLGLSSPDPDSQKEGCDAMLCSGKLADFYREYGPVIFPPEKNRVRNRFSHAFRTKYDDKVINKILLDVFGDATLNQLYTNAVVTSYDTENRKPMFFKNTVLKNGKQDENFYVRDAARATIAAPTYFPPARIKPVPDCGTAYTLIDGGIYANNPALIAYFETKKIFPDADRYEIISMGTGVVDKPFCYDMIKNWGFMDWISAFRGTPLIEMMLDGQNDMTCALLESLPDVAVYRFNFHLDEKAAVMDNAGNENLKNLEDIAERLIRENQHALNAIAASAAGSRR
ncbi:MAG: patatin-like phospholipase family protein [Spirochaetia bacterium]